MFLPNISSVFQNLLWCVKKISPPGSTLLGPVHFLLLNLAQIFPLHPNTAVMLRVYRPLSARSHSTKSRPSSYWSFASAPLDSHVPVAGQLLCHPFYVYAFGFCRMKDPIIDAFFKKIEGSKLNFTWTFAKHIGLGVSFDNGFISFIVNQHVCVITTKDHVLILFASVQQYRFTRNDFFHPFISLNRWNNNVHSFQWAT